MDKFRKEAKIMLEIIGSDLHIRCEGDRDVCNMLLGAMTIMESTIKALRDYILPWEKEVRVGDLHIHLGKGGEMTSDE